MENTIYLQRTLTGNVNTNSNLVFNEILFNSGSITYNTLNGEISLNQIGKYHFSWWISTQNVNSGLKSEFTLVCDDSNNNVSNSQIKTNNYSGIGIIEVTSVPKIVKLVNTSSGTTYLSPTVDVKAMLSILMIEDSGSADTMYNYQIMQLSNVLTQIISLYPENIISVFVRGLLYIIGTPTSLFYSSTGPGLFIVTDEGTVQAIPLNMITAVYAGDGSIYDNSITYLPTPAIMPSGWDTNTITAVKEYLPVGTPVSVYFSIGNSREGYVYKNECGIIVITADLEGLQPTFIPDSEASIIIPTVSSKKKVEPKKSIV